jgi:hypothetical protein
VIRKVIRETPAERMAGATRPRSRVSLLTNKLHKLGWESYDNGLKTLKVVLHTHLPTLF